LPQSLGLLLTTLGGGGGGGQLTPAPEPNSF